MSTATQAPNTFERYVRFALNVPQTLSLKYEGPGSQVEGKFGPQVRYVLEDGRFMYLDRPVAAKLDALKLRDHEPFIATKREVGYAGNVRKVEWSFVRPDPRSQPHAESPAAALLDRSDDLSEPDGVNHSHIPTKLESALKTAVAAAAAAEKHAESLGYSCRFSSGDVRAMGISVLIAMNQEGR